MTLRLLAFSAKGMRLAQKLAADLGGEARRCGKSPMLQQWTEAAFAEASALIFVGAAGIAVRAIAPYIKSKTTDPAVVVVDECGRFAIPILSGHLGGANDLARQIAPLCGAVPVITTATDANERFSADAWARHQNCCVENPERIKLVSGKLLAGKAITLTSAWPIAGTPPQGVMLTASQPADVTVGLDASSAEALHLVPCIAVLGVGCKKGTPQETIEAAFICFLQQAAVSPAAIQKVCTIDLKQNEAGLLAFCQAHRWPVEIFTADELQAVPGQFSRSAFVQSITGVDNVCERSAVLGSGGTLIRKKFAKNGVTFALAAAPFTPDWRWKYE